MTDYLEALLSLQEQEEGRELLEWKKPVFPLIPQGRRKEKRQLADGAEQRLRNETEWLEERSRREQGSTDDMRKHSATKEDSASASSKLELESGLTVQMTQLYRAVRRVSAQAGRGMVPGTDTPDTSRRDLWSVGLPAVKETDCATLVDRVFARDARRYDGLLGLL